MTGSLPYAARLSTRRSGENSTSSHLGDETDFEQPLQASAANHVINDTPVPQYLVPVRECLEEAYKPPRQQVKEGLLNFQEMMPDLLFGDLDSSVLMPVPGRYGTKQEDRALFMHYYYHENEIETLDCKPTVGAEKMVSLTISSQLIS